MKKLICVLSAAAIVLSFAGCTPVKKTAEPQTAESTATEPQTAESTAAESKDVQTEAESKDVQTAAESKDVQTEAGVEPDYDRLYDLILSFSDHGYNCKDPDAFAQAARQLLLGGFFCYSEDFDEHLNPGEDPRGIFTNEYLGVDRVNADFIDSIVREVFCVEPDHSYEFKIDNQILTYYDNGYYYIYGLEGGSAPGLHLKSHTVDENGVYTIVYRAEFPEGDVGEYVITARPITFMGKSDWQFYSIVHPLER